MALNVACHLRNQGALAPAPRQLSSRGRRRLIDTSPYIRQRRSRRGPFGGDAARSARSGDPAEGFHGELVPQDPKDEPASVLLERIRAGRTAHGQANRADRAGRLQPAQPAASLEQMGLQREGRRRAPPRGFI